MTRIEASQFAREHLNKNGLAGWSVRLNNNPDSHYLGLCSYKDKTIILNAHHIDIHPDPDIRNTILHEIAHALCPGHAHDGVWSDMARRIGCDNTLPCSNLSLSPEIIDAIRSGADVEVTFEEHTIRTPKYNITRLQDKCDVCGKVAKTLKEKLVEIKSDTKPDKKFIYLECGHTIIKNIPKGTPFHLFQSGGDEKCEHTWDKNKCILCGRFRPFQFQIEGMRFLEAALAVNKGGAVFDGMGLGKTIQAMGLLKFHPENYPTLWIVKAGLKYQIAVMILNWMGDDHVPQVVDTSKDWLIPKLKHYIIGYDMLVPKSRTLKSGKVVTSGFDITQFDRVGIKCVVLDECQQIKNVDSSRTQMTRRVVKNRKVIPLSGTPWNNRGSELFPVLNMMNPIKFNSEEGFKRDWVATYWEGKYLKEGGIKRIPQFREFTKDMIIRRERSEVMPELPLTNRTKLHVKMTEQQEEVYDEAVEDFVKWHEEQIGELTGMAIIAAMQKMRHMVGLAKIPATMEYLDEFIEDTDRKIVIFAHHIDVQNQLYDEAYEKYGVDKKDKNGNIIRQAIPVFKIFAETEPYERNNVADRFNAAPRAILIASQLAAGEGLNLQTCSDVVMHERQWNPGKEEQCEDRFPRPGQTATSINAVYTHLEGLTTIDPQLDGIVERKRIQFHNTMNKTEMTRWNEDSIMKELAQTIVNAHNAKKNRKVLAG